MSVTGLPELPEGYFWRVGSVRGMDFREGVAIMRTVKEIKEVRTERKRRWKVFTEIERRVVESELLAHFYEFGRFNFALKGEDLPEGAYEVRLANYSPPGYHFKLPLNEETVLWMANRLFKVFERNRLKQQEEGARQEQYLAAASELFGKYPPKTLSMAGGA